jgi:methionyl-tRNA synthetase
MALIDAVRRGPSQRYLITAAYHTPNGALHLGHLGGPFLSADVLARHLLSIGHEVARITATDAHESYVHLAALSQGRSATEVASANYRSARDTLAAFGMHQDAFIDLGDETWARPYREDSDSIARHMMARKRVELRELTLPRSRRSGRFVIGPFAVGRCPFCSAEAAGTSCEVCGMWFGANHLRDVRPRLEEDDDLEPITVPTVYYKGGPEFSPEEVDRRFPRGASELLERYIKWNGRVIKGTHPLGFGVPFTALDLGHDAVHFSYGSGSCAATYAIAREYRHLTGTSLEPFSRSRPITTVLTAGYDSLLPCMFLLALVDKAVDWEPFHHHVINRFLLLNGRKFSTSAKHVISGPDYVLAGFSPDLFRMYAGSIFSAEAESDFRPSEFSSFVASELQGRLERTTLEALGRAAREPLNSLTGPTRDSFGALVEARAKHLAAGHVDVAAAARAVMHWVTHLGPSFAVEAPYWWLKGLAFLVNPFMPEWATSLWQALGGRGTPSLASIEERGAVVPGLYAPIPSVALDGLERLVPRAASVNGGSP